MEKDGIILIAKQPGPTSFTSLNSIKKAIDSKKVGHTGTLDSFAQGLLVVCTGRLTRLAGNIIDFNKTYRAVIKFGQETDTLEYTGNIIRTTPLPTKEKLEEAVSKFTGKLMQKPPVFSAIHINGKRASDLMRSGINSEIPEREITVFNSKILEIKTDDNNLVEYAQIEFNVSKGTYIRSLARDIGNYCNSSAHLIGLFRTTIGHFNIEQAAGFSKLPDFNILNSIKIMEEQKILIEKEKQEIQNRRELKLPREKFVPSKEELDLQEEIRNKMQDFTEDLAKLCGFNIIHITNEQAVIDFTFARPLRSKNFDIDLHTLPCNSITAAFSKENIFAGLIYKDENTRLHYRLVIN